MPDRICLPTVHCMDHSMGSNICYRSSQVYHVFFHVFVVNTHDEVSEWSMYLKKNSLVSFLCVSWTLVINRQAFFPVWHHNCVERSNSFSYFCIVKKRVRNLIELKREIMDGILVLYHVAHIRCHFVRREYEQGSVINPLLLRILLLLEECVRFTRALTILKSDDYIRKTSWHYQQWFKPFSRRWFLMGSTT